MVETDKTIWDDSIIYTKEGLLGVINGLPLAVAVIDSDLKVAFANKATHNLVNKNELQLIGAVGGEALGCVYDDNIPGGCGFGDVCLKCKLRNTVKKTIENRESYFMVETSMMLKSDGRRHLRITTQPLILQNAEVALVSIEDITEAKKHEQTKLEKEKLSAAVRTAGAVCHEMNQPLMTILGYSELLVDEVGKDWSNKTHLMEIKEQAERLGAITRKLMRITKYKTKGYLNSEILDIDAASIDNPK